MEIELNRFTPAEQATFRLRALYEQAGYRKYRASRFEEYALYQEYQRFLPDSQVITFTDLDGKLRAIKSGDGRNLYHDLFVLFYPTAKE